MQEGEEDKSTSQGTDGPEKVVTPVNGTDPASQPTSFGVPVDTPQLVPVATETVATTPETKQSKKGLLVIVILVFLLVIAAFGYYYFFIMTNSGASEKSVSPTPPPTSLEITYFAQVNSVEGEVFVSNLTGRSEAVQGAKLAEGDTVETGTDAKTVITYSDGSILKIGPNTKVNLTTVNDGEMLTTIEVGVLYATVVANPNRIFKVIAGETVVESLGTAFSVEKTSESLVSVNVFENKVKVINAGEELQIAEKLAWKAGLTKPVAVSSVEISTDNFLQWALEEELKRVEKEIISAITPPADKEDKLAYMDTINSLNLDKAQLQKEAFQKTASGVVGSISMTGNKTSDGGVLLAWTANGLASNGFRLVWSENPGPVYPKRVEGDSQTYNPLFGYEKKIGPFKPGKSYYFRVCEDKGSTCGVYSNELYFSF